MLETKTNSNFATIDELLREVSKVVLPPQRISVSEAVEKYVYLNNPGAYVGPYKIDTAPYMREPMDMLKSRQHMAVVFVGPAQCSKTESLVLGFMAYSICVDQLDMILYNPTMASARDFSVRRVDRMHRHSPEIGKHLLPRRDADNKTDKQYKSGMILTLSYPSAAEFAGKPIPRVLLTDYDRMPMDVDGEGSPFDLGIKRTTSFQSFGKTLAESSPSLPVLDPKWMRSTPHEAPPCEGILGLYNRGDRRRFHWQCKHCEEYFEGDFSQLRWEERGDEIATSETVWMECPTCGMRIEPNDRKAMLRSGVWIAEGQHVDRHGQIHGTPRRSDIASFWMNGTAAAFTTWAKLVRTFLTAQADFERTGSEGALQKFFNTDLGQPYLTKSQDLILTPDVLKSRAEPLGERVVPNDTRFLVACVDVQKNMFKVQVHGIQPGSPYDIVVIDRLDIRKSRRDDEDGDPAWVKPGTYLEDWQLVTDLLGRTYPLADGTGRRMLVRMVVCDSGGKAGVTTNAYNHWRIARDQNLAGRFHLVKGTGLPTAPRAKIDYPDSSRKDRLAGARGDIPVLMLNSNILKDELAGRLQQITPGKGVIRFPDWLPDWFYAELCAEVKKEKGWENTGGARNEAWDLLYYLLGFGYSRHLGLDKIDWNRPPAWAETWEKNILILQPEQEEIFAQKPTTGYDFASLGKSLG